MDKETRLALLVLIIAIAVWRFVRYMRFGLSRSRWSSSLGIAGEESGDTHRATHRGVACRDPSVSPMRDLPSPASYKLVR